MRIVIVVVLVLLVVGGIAALAIRRRTQLAKATPAVAEPAPMLGLESALDQALDRTGRNMRERLATSTSLDDLRVPDDTGPILRRALDQAEQRIEHRSDDDHGQPA